MYQKEIGTMRIARPYVIQHAISHLRLCQVEQIVVFYLTTHKKDICYYMMK